MSTKTYQKEFLTVTRREVDSDRLVSRVTRGPEGHLDSDGDEPALKKIEKIGGRNTKIERWYKSGKWHRDDAPATIVTDLASMVVVQEVFALDGLIHRLKDEPSLIHRDPITGLEKKKEYYNWGKLHRNDGPAVMNFDVQSGRLRSAEHWRDGVRIIPENFPSPDGPD